MSKSLGELCDELSITNIKLWFVQAKVFEADRARESLGKDDVAKLVALNARRNRLISEIDEHLAAGEFRSEMRVKIT